MKRMNREGDGRGTGGSEHRNNTYHGGTENVYSANDARMGRSDERLIWEWFTI